MLPKKSSEHRSRLYCAYHWHCICIVILLSIHTQWGPTVCQVFLIVLDFNPAPYSATFLLPHEALQSEARTRPPHAQCNTSEYLPANFSLPDPKPSNMLFLWPEVPFLCVVFANCSHYEHLFFRKNGFWYLDEVLESLTWDSQSGLTSLIIVHSLLKCYSHSSNISLKRTRGSCSSVCVLISRR